MLAIFASAARGGLNSRIRARRDTLELLSSSGDAAGASGVRRKLHALYERRGMIDDALLTNHGNGGIIDVRLNSIADPLAEVLGSGEESHPHEIASFREELEVLGVTLVEREQESLGYAPGLRPGKPGMIYVSKGASYGAWCHEMQHMRDDRDAGWEGMRSLVNEDRRYQREVRAYQVEIDQAEALGSPVAACASSDIHRRAAGDIPTEWERYISQPS